MQEGRRGRPGRVAGGAGARTAFPSAMALRFAAASLRRVLITQIGFTTIVVSTPAIAAASICPAAPSFASDPKRFRRAFSSQRLNASFHLPRAAPRRQRTARAPSGAPRPQGPEAAVDPK